MLTLCCVFLSGRERPLAESAERGCAMILLFDCGLSGLLLAGKGPGEISFSSLPLPTPLEILLVRSPVSFVSSLWFCARKLTSSR